VITTHTARRHCLIALARSHGLPVPTMLPPGQLVVCVVLMLALDRRSTGIPVDLERPRQRRRQLPATDPIASNAPTAPPVTIPAPIAEAPAARAVAEALEVAVPAHDDRQVGRNPDRP
jgi:hypothetical protein